jgi:hypothetical protein
VGRRRLGRARAGRRPGAVAGGGDPVGGSMHSKTDENRSVFIKTGKPGLDRFCRLTENRPVPFGIFKNFKNEIKNPKKIRLHFKNFDQNKIQKFIVLRPGKIKEDAAGVKIGKKLTGSF